MGLQSRYAKTIIHPLSILSVNKRFSLSFALAAASACMVVNAGKADALLLFEFAQRGSDVALGISGSLSGLPSGQHFSSVVSGWTIDPGKSLISTVAGASRGEFSYSYPVFGSDRLGTVLSQRPPSLTEYSGVNLVFTNEYVVLSGSYEQGMPIVGSGLMSNITLSEIGFKSTSGLLGSWTVGSDSIEVWAGRKPRASAVPGPLPVLGAGAAYAYSRRLRSRLRGAQSAPQS